MQSWPFLFVTGLQNVAQRNKITDHSRSSHCISECSHLMSVLSAMNFVAMWNFWSEFVHRGDTPIIKLPFMQHQEQQWQLYYTKWLITFPLLGTPDWIHKYPQSCGSVYGSGESSVLGDGYFRTGPALRHCPV